MMLVLFALLKGLFMFFMRQTIIVMSRLIEFDLKMRFLHTIKIWINHFIKEIIPVT